jgi:hypothetical protein
MRWVWVRLGSWFLAMLTSSAYAAFVPLGLATKYLPSSTLPVQQLTTQVVQAFVNEAGTAYLLLADAHDLQTVFLPFAGIVTVPVVRHLVTRLDASGQVDATYGQSGFVELLGPDVLFLPDGSLLHHERRQILTRYRANGQLDYRVSSQNCSLNLLDSVAPTFGLVMGSQAVNAWGVGGVEHPVGYAPCAFQAADGTPVRLGTVQVSVPFVNGWSAEIALSRSGHFWLKRGADLFRLTPRGEISGEFGQGGYVKVPPQTKLGPVQFDGGVILLNSTGQSQSRVAPTGVLSVLPEGQVQGIDWQQRLVVITEGATGRALRFANADGEWVSTAQPIQAASLGPSVAANSVGGTVVAYPASRGGKRGVEIEFARQELVTEPAELRVVEFYNTISDRYFITAEATDVAHVESGAAGPGWTRTGEGFRAYRAGASGYAPVCRFYGDPTTGGPNSHFYTASENECAGLRSQRQAEKRGWLLENVAFAVARPEDIGSCQLGSRPVKRWSRLPHFLLGRCDKVNRINRLRFPGTTLF